MPTRPAIPGDWARHEPATSYCYVRAVGRSAITACHGRWPADDEVDVVDPDDVPRCAQCERWVASWDA